MQQEFPIVHIERLVESGTGDPSTGSLTSEALRRTCEHLALMDATTPSVATLAGGIVALASADTPFLLATSDPRVSSIQNWCNILVPQGFSSLLFVASDTFDRADTLRATDLPAATGSGMAVASMGVSGDPLVGLSVGELRRQLRESRDRLSEACGYPVRLLAPAPTPSGRAFDGLVLREARRAGYSLFFSPGGVASIDSAEPPEPITYRSVEAGESVDEICGWIAGDRLVRGASRLRRLLSSPRRFLDRFAPSND